MSSRVILALLLLVAAPTAWAITEVPVPTPGSDPEVITMGPDGDLWFTEFGADKIGRVTRGGVFTEYVLPLGSGPLGIAAGPDGNLWFTEAGRDRIGRITPAGVVTEFLLESGRTPARIAAGPDGALWFTEFDGNRIGRLNPSAGDAAAIQASLTEFAVPGGGQPFSITAGPDGRLWFTEAGSNEIGAITTDGVVAEFGSGLAQRPQGITVGSDGNLWYGSALPNFIGRISTTGAQTTFTGFGTLRSTVRELVAGADGALWYTDIGAHRIGRLATTGAVTIETPTPTAASSPVGIALAPNGNLWFVEGSAARVGVMNPAGPAEPVTLVSIDDVTVTEGSGGTTSAAFTVALFEAAPSMVQVSFATADGTATAPDDYQTTSGMLTFMPGETQKAVAVSIAGDTTFEPDETFDVTLSASVSSISADGRGVGTIANDDVDPCGGGCDDGNACTTDACDASGCTHQSLGVACELGRDAATLCTDPIDPKLLKFIRRSLSRAKTFVDKLTGASAAKRQKLVRKADKRLAAIARKAGRNRKLGAACKAQIAQEMTGLRELLAATAG